jgi:hypothetical protein
MDLLILSEKLLLRQCGLFKEKIEVELPRFMAIIFFQKLIVFIDPIGF